ncbi:MAG TPA: FkbM family methyltransferase, partial [Hyphomicrobiaceae bacterium]|nr:FkbM family methyltransferase [Hyphomicrobiaceae bacterium]
EVALVKIDVEGHELSVLEGMRSLLQVRVPILVELTAERGNNERLERFKSLLCPFYEHVLDLSDESPVSRPSQSISAFRLRSSQSDLLIY